MAKRHGNPNWGRSYMTPLIPATVSSSFDEVARSLGLTPDQYASSRALRDWACHNRTQKYVPEALLDVWDLESDTEF
jgi:hypothetical protein